MSKDAVLELPPPPETTMITRAGWRCLRCTHEWVPKRPDLRPRICPKCKTASWDLPKPQPKNATAAAVASTRKLKSKSKQAK